MTTPMLSSSLSTHGRPKLNNHAETVACLDALQLIQLEWSFRQWVRITSDYEARLARHRLLMVFLLLRYADASLEQVLALNLGADLVGQQLFVREPEGKGCSVREVVLNQPIADEIREALTAPDLGGLLFRLHELSFAEVEQSIVERAEACGFPAQLCSPEMIRWAGTRALVGSGASASSPRPLRRPEPSPASSMAQVDQNLFLCRIEEIRRDALQSQVQLCIETGYCITALISKESADRLALRQGGLVRAEVKAHTVNLHLQNNQAASSVDNCFSGNLVGMTRGRVAWACVVDIGGGRTICALLSAHYAATLGLRLGKKVWVTFNSFAVIVRRERVRGGRKRERQG